MKISMEGTKNPLNAMIIDDLIEIVENAGYTVTPDEETAEIGSSNLTGKEWIVRSHSTDGTVIIDSDTDKDILTLHPTGSYAGDLAAILGLHELHDAVAEILEFHGPSSYHEDEDVCWNKLRIAAQSSAVGGMI